MRLCRCCFLFFTLAFGITTIAAQTSVPDSASTVFPFQSKVNVVLVDVVVTNGKDEPVTGLDKKDFQVLEDGKKQVISVFEEHKGVLQIPEGSIIYDKDKKASVEVPDPKAKEGKRKLAVNIGISNGAKTELLQGLKEGDQVVLQ